MNNKTAVMIEESISGQKAFGSRKKKNKKLNSKLCPNLEFIGSHIYEGNCCRYCGQPLSVVTVDH